MTEDKTMEDMEIPWSKNDIEVVVYDDGGPKWVSQKYKQLYRSWWGFEHESNKRTRFWKVANFGCRNRGSQGEMKEMKVKSLNGDWLE